jgi:hypothetical protein
VNGKHFAKSFSYRTGTSTAKRPEFQAFFIPCGSAPIVATAIVINA